MNELFVASIERKNFGWLLAPDPSVNVRRMSLDGASLPDPGSSLLAIWSTDPRMTGALPDVLICGDREREDWIAWITTYAKILRPISSFCRVLELSEARGLLGTSEALELGRLSWAFSGLVLGEVLAASNLADSQLETLPTAAFTSTLSFAVIRAYAVLRFEHVEAVESAWRTVRFIAGQKERSVPADVTARVCRIVLAAAGVETLNDRRLSENALAVETCSVLISDARSVPRAFRAMPGFSAAYAAMEGPREMRVIEFSKFLESSKSSLRESDRLAHMAIGFLASRVAPGTILHASLLDGVSKLHAEVLLWYGFFAGLPSSREGELFQSRSRLGTEMPLAARRVLKELQRKPQIFSKPTADVSLFELVALGRTGKPVIDSLPRFTNSILLVELLPGVDVAIGISHKQHAETRSVGVAPAALKDLGAAIDSLREVHRQLMGGANPGVAPSAERSPSSPRKPVKRAPSKKKKS